MLELIKPGSKFDFVGWRYKGFIFSGILTGISILAVLIFGHPKMGVDFRGGTEIQVKFNQAVQIDELRDVLDKSGISGISVQRFGGLGVQEYLVRFPVAKQEDSARIHESLTGKFGEKGFEIKREESVGPRVGKELRNKAMLATIFALVGILIYIAYRFEFRFGVGTVIATIHDLIVAYGAMKICGYELNLTSVASLLTLAGYSVNDTVVVFDRIRENMRKLSRQRFEEVMNAAINETLSRTIITSGATFLTVAAIFFFGGPVLRDFSFVLLIGIVIGTYSSIFIASPVLLFWKQKFGKKKK
ncbi:MAG: protein translocase subunit SecF [bacterium]|nr:protein translocase subunit SecF [bacterium]